LPLVLDTSQQEQATLHGPNVDQQLKLQSTGKTRTALHQFRAQEHGEDSTCWRGRGKGQGRAVDRYVPVRVVGSMLKEVERAIKFEIKNDEKFNELFNRDVKWRVSQISRLSSANSFGITRELYLADQNCID
jgi:hypothetical protein